MSPNGALAAAFLFAHAPEPAGIHDELLLGPEEEAMGTGNWYGDLGSYAETLIQRKAMEVAELYGLTHEDREDIEQELALKVLTQKDKYDPKRGKWTTFVVRVVDHAIADILDAHKAAKRDPGRCECSLNELVPDGEGGLVERTQTLDYETYQRPWARRTQQELQDLRLDVEAAVEKLPPRLRQVCEMLKEQDPSKVAERMGIPRTTLQYMIKKIRSHLERAGLAEHLPRNIRMDSESSRK